MKNTRIALTGMVLATALALTACSSASTDTKADQTKAPGKTKAPVVIDKELKSKIDVESGSAVIPGSIESAKQKLSTDCTAFVAPMRDLMTKYPSLRQVPPDGTYKKAFDEAKKCEAANAQHWADFYVKELAGWIYAKS